MLSCIVLAAGEARRMQTNKLLLPFRQSTVLGETLAIYASVVDHLIVVSGRHIQSLRKHIPHPRIRWIENPESDKGLETSLRAGLLALDAATHAVLIAHGDMPMIQTETVAGMIRMFQTGAIVIPRYHGRKGHPILMDAEYREYCFHPQLTQPLRALIQHYSDRILYLDTDDQGILLDIDHWDDYYRLNYSVEMRKPLKKL